MLTGQGPQDPGWYSKPSNKFCRSMLDLPCFVSMVDWVIFLSHSKVLKPWALTILKCTIFHHKKSRGRPGSRYSKIRSSVSLAWFLLCHP